MSNKEQAKQAKDRGNAAFSKGDFQTAVKEFTDAINLDSTDHVFFSNRSGAYASMGDYQHALEDADKCISLNSAFAKGYSRKGLALFNMHQYEEAIATYESGLKIEPSNAQMKDGLEQARKSMSSAKNPMARLFGPDMWIKLSQDPSTRDLINDPNVNSKLKMLQSNPGLFSSFSQDPSIMKCMMTLLGIGGAGFPGGADVDMQGAEEDERSDAERKIYEEERKKQAEEEEKKRKEEEERKKREAAAKELSPEEKAAQEQKKKAEAEKEVGNKLYKEMKFEEALKHYQAAHDFDPKNGTYPNNMAIVYFAQKDWDRSIQKSKEAIELWREAMADFKLVAKAFLRVGNCHFKCKRWQEAVDAFHHSLLEDFSDEAKNNLKKAEAEKQKADKAAYLDPSKALENKEKGNTLYKAAKYAEAIQEYSEAIKRDPSLVAVYSNRAACYSKLMDWGRGLEDCDTCLKLDPSFVKAYIRKGKIQHFLKQYHKALETYNQGLALDRNNAELKEAKALTLVAIQRENAQGVDPQRQKEALKDPEIQAILKDPIISKVLNDLQTDPSAAQAAFADERITQKLEKLMAAGVLQMSSR